LPSPLSRLKCREDKDEARKEFLEESVVALSDDKETWPRFGGKDAVREFVEQLDVSLALAM
jgi:hypothetical protein